MIKKISGVALLLAFVSVITFTPVSYAVESTGSNAATASTPQSRVLERQAKLNETLTVAQAARIKARCAAAQNIIQNSAQKINEYNGPALANYEKLITQLNTVMKQRSSIGKNVGQLSGDVATLTQKYQTYKVAYETATLDLNDLSTIDCAASPAGFSATLKQSRTDLQTMRADRADLGAFTKNTITKDLQSIKQEQ